MNEDCTSTVFALPGISEVSRYKTNPKMQEYKQIQTQIQTEKKKYTKTPA